MRASTPTNRGRVFPDSRAVEPPALADVTFPDTTTYIGSVVGGIGGTGTVSINQP